MAQKRILGARHQKTHDVVADASEFLRLSLGGVGRSDAPETLLVRLLLRHVVAAARKELRM